MVIIPFYVGCVDWLAENHVILGSNRRKWRFNHWWAILYDLVQSDRDYDRRIKDTLAKKKNNKLRI
jgi:hypothetical protein